MKRQMRRTPAVLPRALPAPARFPREAVAGELLEALPETAPACREEPGPVDAPDPSGRPADADAAAAGEGLEEGLKADWGGSSVSATAAGFPAVQTPVVSAVQK